jgi:hypothetical protein
VLFELRQLHIIWEKGTYYISGAWNMSYFQATLTSRRFTCNDDNTWRHLPPLTRWESTYDTAVRNRESAPKQSPADSGRRIQNW